MLQGVGAGMVIPLSFRLHLELRETGTDDTVSSVQQLARGLTLGALMNAVAQAIGSKAAELPVTDEDLELLYRGR